MRKPKTLNFGTKVSTTLPYMETLEILREIHCSMGEIASNYHIKKFADICYTIQK